MGQAKQRATEISKLKETPRDRKLGQIFTPSALVNEMLDKFPKDIWNDPTKTSLDPTCGNGNFIVEVIRRKVQAGNTVLQALATTYGVEIDKAHRDDCVARIIELANELLQICPSKNVFINSVADIDKINLADKNSKIIVGYTLIDLIKLIVETNIVCGDTLKLMKNGDTSCFRNWVSEAIWKAL